MKFYNFENTLIFYNYIIAQNIESRILYDIVYNNVLKKYHIKWVSSEETHLALSIQYCGCQMHSSKLSLYTRDRQFFMNSHCDQTCRKNKFFTR